MIAVMFNDDKNPDQVKEEDALSPLNEPSQNNVQLNSSVTAPVSQSVDLQSALSPAVSEPAVSATNLAEPTPKRSHKGLVISLISVVAALLIGAGGFAGWYFMVRTPDTEYEKAVSYLDSMIADATAMKNYDSILKDDKPATVTTTSVDLASDDSDAYQAALKKLNDAKDEAAEYLSKQKLLQESKVITSDTSVKIVYDTNKKVINEYGPSADEYYRTGAIFYTMMSYCSTLSDLSDVETVDEYDLEAKQCKDYMLAHETTPSKTFNETYVPYRKVMLNMVQILHDYIGAKTPAQQSVAQQKMMALYGELGKIDLNKAEEVKTSQNPVSQLKAVRDKVVERKSLFFR